jgi:bifunctional non-homologous end joining protein LigD
LLAAMTPLGTAESPFAQPLPRLDAKDARWVRPELVVEVRYGQLTTDERLRFPRFVRLRPDLTAAEVALAQDQVGTAEPLDDAEEPDG